MRLKDLQGFIMKSKSPHRLNSLLKKVLINKNTFKEVVLHPDSIEQAINLVKKSKNFETISYFFGYNINKPERIFKIYIEDYYIKDSKKIDREFNSLLKQLENAQIKLTQLMITTTKENIMIESNSNLYWMKYDYTRKINRINARIELFLSRYKPSLELLEKVEIFTEKHY